MKSPQGLWMVLAAAVVIGSSVGCYTLLKHPRLQTEHDARSVYEVERVSFVDDCASCHDPAFLTPHWGAVPRPGQFLSPRWDYYYDYPWWRPYYAVDHNASEEGEEQKQRPFDRRHIRQPEENNPGQVAAPQQEPPPAPTVIAKPSDGGNNPPANQPPREDTNKREEKRSGESKSNERRTRKPNQDLE